MIRWLLALAVVGVAAVIELGSSGAAVGRLVDASTRQPIADGVVVTGESEIRTDARGMFRLPAPLAGDIRVRAHGYERIRIDAATLAHAPDVALRPLRPKAVYLSMFGIGSRTLREAALDLIATTELNALVIDVKGDRGGIPYRSALPLAAQIGAQRTITIPDLPALLTILRQRQIYTIARIVAFKDDPLASARPDLAVHRKDGSRYRDREGLSWTDPHSAEVRAYNIGIAREAAQAGFDEIQFDYTRMPDTTGLAYAEPDTAANRVAAIDGFLRDARTALRPYNVFLAVDIFGYVCWNPGDTRIGQQLEHLVGLVDYVSPMLYPSSFHAGIPGVRNPVEHPYDIVRRSVERALERTKLPAVRIRPWLQAFPDYAFGGRPFTAGEVARQIDAADESGTNGWMLWNPHNRYSRGDLAPAVIGLDSAARSAPRP